MKYYAIFHSYTGDRSVLRLDGRHSRLGMHAAALAHARKHKMDRGTYTIERGAHLSQTFEMGLPRKLSDYL